MILKMSRPSKILMRLQKRQTRSGASVALYGTWFWDRRCLDGVLERHSPCAKPIEKAGEANAAVVNDLMEIMDWINLFAFAVSEENAAGGHSYISNQWRRAWFLRCIDVLPSLY